VATSLTAQDSLRRKINYTQIITVFLYNVFLQATNIKSTYSIFLLYKLYHDTANSTIKPLS